MRQAALRYLSILGIALIPLPGYAQEAEPYPRIDEEGYRARLPFFDHHPEIPLEARIVREWNKGGTCRQKLVFRGAQGFLVPGYLEMPDAAERPLPLVLLLHGWSGSKEQWYVDGNIVSGGEMRRGLLDAGFAILALDAATHGERSNEIDYLHVNAFEDPNAPARYNYFSFAEIAIQTVKDYRRALDCMAQREEIDMSRLGLVGYSMGGMHAFILASVEPRIKAFVACVVPPKNVGYDPASPIDYSWGVKDKPFLMLMGREDEMYDAGRIDASYRAWIEGPQTRLIWYERGHKLTPEYVPDARDWLESNLKP
jgi:dienelactone hydrolase